MITLYSLIECFFVFAFTFILYKNNIHIIFGLLPLYFILKGRMYKSTSLFILLFFLLIVLYYVHDGIPGAYRVLKTIVVLLPVYYTNFLHGAKRSLGQVFRVFMTVNALLVCVDFVLYLTIGKTIMSFTESGIMPRPCGLLEDSNFFSYLMLISIFYYRWQDGRFTKLFVLSLFLSGSFSAIISFVVLCLIYKFIRTGRLCNMRLKVLYIMVTLLIIFIYDRVAIYPEDMLYILSKLDVNDLIKVKFMSMTHRFTTVSNAMGAIDGIEDILLGIGAGKTRALSDIGLNLHNSFLQMFLEMGGILTSLVVIVLLYMLWHIRQIQYVILFCMILILSSIMETFYNPLLAFVYYISFLDKNYCSYV